MLVGSDPLLTVSEFVAVFNQSLEITFPRVGVVGELANFRVSRNQWVYLDLKDDESQIKFFGTTRQLPGPLEDGLKLEIYGRPRLHAKYGFSINIEEIRVSGEGSIKKAQDLLAKKLETEGLFDPARKRMLPFAPTRIGLITAADSAACSDFKKIVDARWGSINVQLIDVAVQGAGSSKQIIAAIRDFNEKAEPPEVLVVIRGGGSSEDLASFSDEKVVRAIASSRIPTLVAIGHESDVSLAELAADMRASTPSNAAEILVPDAEHEKRMLQMWVSRLDETIATKLDDQKRLLAEQRINMDDRVSALLASTSQNLQHYKSLVLLLDPKAPLRRGYTVTRDKRGNIIRSAKDVRIGDELFISLQDGRIVSEVKDKDDG